MPYPHRSANANVNMELKSAGKPRKGYVKTAQKQVLPGWLSKACKDGECRKSKCFSLRCSCACHRHGK